MIDLTYIRGFYPPQIANNANFQKHLLKEYIECLAMEWISQSAWSDKLAFIGGTNLWQRTKPDYEFLKQRHGIESEEQLRTLLQETVAHTDLKTKQRDFEHLLFEPRKSEQILHFLEILAIA